MGHDDHPAPQKRWFKPPILLKEKKATSDLWLPAVSPNDYPSIPRRTEGRLRFDVDQCPLPLKG